MPIKGNWRYNPDQLEVKMHIFGRLAFAYQTKTTADEISEWLADRRGVRRVVKQLSNTFWFIRDVLQNAPDIMVISPDSVRDRLNQKLRLLGAEYDMNIAD